MEGRLTILLSSNNETGTYVKVEDIDEKLGRSVSPDDLGEIYPSAALIIQELHHGGVIFKRTPQGWKMGGKTGGFD